MITAEGEALLPVVGDAFDRLATTLDRVGSGKVRELLVVGAVGTFAVGWLLRRLEDFRRVHPFVDLRFSTNNNRVDMAAEGLDFSIRFGDGAWHGLEATELFEAPLTPLCTPELAGKLRAPKDLFSKPERLYRHIGRGRGRPPDARQISVMSFRSAVVRHHLA
jgi:LysR family transcriptional regulator of beta-lactamase